MNKKLDEALIKAEERQTAEKKECEEVTKNKAKERRKIIAACVAAKCEKEKNKIVP